MYYSDKLQSLSDIFGTEASLDGSFLVVGQARYPIVKDVIILLEPSQYPPALRHLALQPQGAAADGRHFAPDIQFTFGEEWKSFPEIMPEHEREFANYFDIVDLKKLKGSRVCDLGCGIGRWSHFLRDKCRELVLVDFSEAIFVARENLKGCDTALFFMGDLRALPFRKRFADFLFSLGVLHHLPTNAFDEIRRLKDFSPALLIYLYYALDNRPAYFKPLLRLVTVMRVILAKIRSPLFRRWFTWFGTLFIYLPLIWLGRLLKPFKLENAVPLYPAYHAASLSRIRQDVYDRFFTRIEQRFSRRDILGLKGHFPRVTVSDNEPYWHFLCHSD